MKREKAFVCKVLSAVLVLVLLVPLFAACGGDDDKEATTTTLPTDAESPTSTTAASGGPVKIGAINSWSGPAAVSGMYYADPVIELVEKQVQEAGGILGGRPVKVVRFDNAAQVAKAVAGATKLVLDDRVSALVFGGIGGAETTAVADEAEKLGVPFFSTATIAGVAGRTFAVEATVPWSACINDVMDVLTDRLEVKTVAFLIHDDAEVRRLLDEWKSAAKAVDIKTVYSAAIPPGTTDLNPYLTRIKHEDPDALVFLLTNEQSLALAKMSMDLGGWGDIRVVGFPQALSAAKMPGAEGWYVLTFWHPAMENPGAIKFREDYKSLHGKMPDLNHVYFYFCLHAAIEAIKLAGSDDPLDIAKAARSGNLEFDTPMGLVRFTADGTPVLSLRTVEIQKGGNLVLVE